MTDLAAKYAIPPEVMTFVEDGLLVPLRENEAEKTVEFHLPSLRHEDDEGRTTSYGLTWIHPDFNAQFCHIYREKPGDLPHFFVTRDIEDVGDEEIEGLETVDELVAWLSDHAVTAS